MSNSQDEDITPTSAFHTGMFVGSLSVTGTVAVAAFWGLDSIWTAGGGMLLLWILAATFGSEGSRHERGDL